MLESKKIKKELFILQEGDDVYMSCSVTANPPISHIVWTHNVSGNKNVVFSFFGDVYISVHYLINSKLF